MKVTSIFENKQRMHSGIDQLWEIVSFSKKILKEKNKETENQIFMCLIYTFNTQCKLHLTSECI